MKKFRRGDLPDPNSFFPKRKSVDRYALESFPNSKRALEGKTLSPEDIEKNKEETKRKIISTLKKEFRQKYDDRVFTEFLELFSKLPSETFYIYVSRVRHALPPDGLYSIYVLERSLSLYAMMLWYIHACSYSDVDIPISFSKVKTTYIPQLASLTAEEFSALERCLSRALSFVIPNFSNLLVMYPKIEDIWNMIRNGKEEV